MTKAEQLLALAVRCEEATGAGRELDAAIYQSLNPTHLPIPNAPVGRFYDPDMISARGAEKFITRGTFIAPNWSKSLDAALSLVPGEAMRKSGDSAIGLMGDFFCDIVIGDGRDFHGNSANEPLAICAASLRALAAMEA